MGNRKVILYTYDSDTQTLRQTFDLIIERTITNQDKYRETECVFAYDPYQRIRIAVSDRPNKVYHDRQNHHYQVWYDNPNKEDAIRAISNYILDHIGPVIRDSESFLKALQEKRLGAIKLLEDLK